MSSRFVQSEDRVVFSTTDTEQEERDRQSREAQEDFDMQCELEYARLASFEEEEWI